LETIHIKLLGVGSLLLGLRLALTWVQFRQDKVRKKIVDLADAGIVAVVITLVLVTFVFRVSQVQGESMSPTLRDGQLTLVNLLSYHMHAPQRGDIIVFRAPTERRFDYVKRIVGLPRDTVEIRHGTTYLNGLRIEEPYADPAEDQPDLPKVKLGPGQFFVMGDNRGNSTDSRHFGPVAMDRIFGKDAFILWPASEAGRIPEQHTRFARN
jgi:signal peptidase I